MIVATALVDDDPGARTVLFRNGAQEERGPTMAQSLPTFAFVYIPLAHWVRGGDFLASMGVLDFAGGLVVHLSAGTGGLGLRRPLARHRHRHRWWACSCPCAYPVSRNSPASTSPSRRRLAIKRLRYLNTIELPGA
jgi:hypothetical protein